MFKNNIFTNKRIIVYSLVALLSLIAIIFAFIKQQKTKIYIFPENSLRMKLDGSETGEYFYKSERFALPRGNYLFSMNLENNDIDDDSNIVVYLFLNNDDYIIQEFDAASLKSGNISVSFALDEPTDWAHFTINTGFEIKDSVIALFSDRYIYNDYWIYAILFVLITICLVLIERKFSLKQYKKQWIVLGFTCILVCIPILTCGKVTLITDTRAHLLRIEGIYKGFLDGQLHVLVYPNANNEFGQTGTLYPALFLYFPALLRLMNVSMYAAFKIAECTVHISTVLVAYYCGRHLFNDENKALLLSVLYTFDFHRIDTAYNEGGLLGNGVAIVFFPLVVLGLFSIFYDNKKHWWSLPLGLSLVFYSHILSLVMMALLVVVFAVININKVFDKEVLKCIGKSIILFLLLSAGNIYAFLRFYLLGFESDILVFIDWTDTIVDIEHIKKSGIETYINDAIILFVVFSVIAILLIMSRIIKINSNIGRFEIHCLAVAVLFMIIMSKLTPWGLLLKSPIIHKVTDMLQYSARFFYITQLLIDILVVYVVFNKTIIKWIRYVILGLFLCQLLLHFGVKSNDTYRIEPLLFDEVIGDYNSWRNNDYLLKGTKDEWMLTSVGNVSDEDKVMSYEYHKVRGRVKYVYSTEYDGQYAEFPLICYPGYQAINDLGEKLNVVKGDKNRLRVMLTPTVEPRTVNISYKVGIDYYLFDLVSLITFVFGFLYLKKAKEN